MKHGFIKRFIPTRPNRSIVVDVLLILFLFLVAAVMALPIVYAISNSLKPLEELWVFPPKFLVRNPTFQNFKDLLNVMSSSMVPFTRYIFNTILVTSVGTGLHVICASMCAYALGKLRFKGRTLIFSILVMSLMFNATVTTIPNFMIMTGLHMIDTYWALIVPAIGAPIGLYLMKQFIEQFPDALLEAARIDGLREFGVFWRIVMPNMKPAWLTLIVFSVQTLWNTSASVYIYEEDLKPLGYAFQQITAAGISRAGVGSAAAVVMISVPVVIFLFTQSRIIETMTSAGMKD